MAPAYNPSPSLHLAGTSIYHSPSQTSPAVWNDAELDSILRSFEKEFGAPSMQAPAPTGWL
jgi:hypothetical protein